MNYPKLITLVLAQLLRELCLFLESFGLRVSPASLGRRYLEKRLTTSPPAWRRITLLGHLITVTAHDGDELASQRAANDLMAIDPYDMLSVFEVAERFEKLGKIEQARTLYLRVVNEPSDMAKGFKTQLRKHANGLVADK